MKKILIVSLLLLIGGVLLYFTVFSGRKNDIRLLVFTRTEGFRHESIADGRDAIEKLAARNNFKVDFSENSDDFNEENLQQYQAVIFLSTSGDIFTPEQQVQLERFIQAGGGFVGIHAATTTEYAWPWYGLLVGGYFAGHPPEVVPAALDIINPNHAATDSLPARWERSDEWYNYKSLNPDNRILIAIDESTYEGGTHDGDHPIAWYKEFDGGRMFYTGLGHTSESYKEPFFLKHLEGGIKYAIGPGMPVDYSRAYSYLVPEENRFTRSTFLENLDEPMELDFLSDTEVLFIERKGGIHIYDLETSERRLVTNLPVYSGLEDGLLGVAVDPGYADNHFVYLYYSAPDSNEQRVARFVLDAGVLDMNSEKILLRIPVQRESCCHSAGSLEFGPDRTLFVSVGDNTNPHESDGYSPSDERAGRSNWDAQKSASNTNDLRGKILRIRITDDGYDIPEGNLFAQDSGEGKPEIYIMGNRNPYRISVDPKNGTLYWGEVGPDATADSVGRGPRGYDEFNMATSAGNYGWPYFTGDNFPYTKYDFNKQLSGQLFDAEKPENTSPNNTGSTVLPPARPALIYYSYDVSDQYPHLGAGSRNAMAGPVFYSDEYKESDIGFPEYFNGKPLFYDWMRQWIYVVNLSEEGELDHIARIIPNMKFSNIIDMAYGPDGALYVLEYGSGWFSQNPDAALSRIEYTTGNRRPVANISANKTIGAAPMEVRFSAQNSLDYDGDQVTYEWDLGDGSRSEETTFVHVYDEPGRYMVRLTVKDESGLQASDTHEILAGNERPEVTWDLSGGNRTFYFPGEPLRFNYSVDVSDPEDGSLTKGEISPDDVIVSVNYLAEGQDVVQVYLNHKNNTISPGEAGKLLIADSDCMACHKESDASIGPSFRQIAGKYADQENAANYLADKIINGGSGTWGETAMAAHPGLSEADAFQMVEYIRTFADRKKSARAPSGTMELRDHIRKMGGTYILTASYTDRGGPNARALSAMETLYIRGPRVEAETFDGGQAMKVPVKADDVPGIEEDMTIVVGMENTFLQYSALDMSGIDMLTLKVGLAATFTKGGFLEVRLDGLDGTLAARVGLEQGLTTFSIDTYEVDISTITGMHDLYLVFVSDEPENEKPVAVIDWLEFSRAENN